MYNNDALVMSERRYVHKRSEWKEFQALTSTMETCRDRFMQNIMSTTDIIELTTKILTILLTNNFNQSHALFLKSNFGPKGRRNGTKIHSYKMEGTTFCFK